MLSRKSMLGLAIAGLFVAGPVAKSFGVPLLPHSALLSMISAAPDEDNEKKHEKHEEHDEKDEEKEHGEKKHKEKEIEQAVPMAMVPQAIIDAVMKECPGGKITEAELQAKKGKINYTFDVKVGEIEYDVVIGVDGKFISKEADYDADKEKDEKRSAAPAEKN